MTYELTVGSVFTGLGGLDLGLERAGMRIVWQCESDPWRRAVLRRHWPTTPCYEDIRDLGIYSRRADVLAGGFPCQPWSVAGARRGFADDRWLWPEFARAIGVLRPSYVIVENVPGLLDGGMGAVLGDLADLGFNAEWSVISACSVGASHLRERVFIVAYATSLGLEGWGAEWPGLGVEALPSAPVRWNTPPPYVCRGTDGIPEWLVRLDALGNAVVPAVGEVVGRIVTSAHNRGGA